MPKILSRKNLCTDRKTALKNCSLNENFLNQYKDSMNDADEAIVYYNPHTIEHKKLKPISIEQVRGAFGKKDLTVFTNSDEMKNHLLKTKKENSVLLMMSSGNFDGIDFKELAKNILKSEF